MKYKNEDKWKFFVRGGEVIKEFEEKLSMEIKYKDQVVPEGKKAITRSCIHANI